MVRPRRSGTVATDVGRAGNREPIVNRTGRTDARRMTPEGVIAGQKARPHAGGADADREWTPAAGDSARCHILFPRANIRINLEADLAGVACKSKMCGFEPAGRSPIG